jgi:hypothetical protein
MFIEALLHGYGCNQVSGGETRELASIAEKPSDRSMPDVFEATDLPPARAAP